MSRLLPPAPSPCDVCPYRRDVPSGVWHADDYAKLPLYDRPTWEQPVRVFQCHVYEEGDDRARTCGGWAGCHDGGESLSVRLAVARGGITLETAEAIRGYVSPVPLFSSGAEAAAHGMREIHDPGPEALAAMNKIERIRTDLIKE